MSCGDLKLTVSEFLKVWKYPFSKIEHILSTLGDYFYFTKNDFKIGISSISSWSKLTKTVENKHPKGTVLLL